MEKLKEAINNYLEQDTDYALMINGSWGSGKTHFWKNYSEELLEEKREKQKRIPVYISLYGLTQISQVSEALSIKLLPLLSIGNFNFRRFSKVQNVYRYISGNETVNTVAQIVGSRSLKLGRDIVKNKIGIDIDNFINNNTIDSLINLVTTENNTNSLILCFDDLERIKFEASEFLGYINRFVEHKRIKTIIICDEEEVKKKSETNKEKYEIFKEKAIGYTYYFKLEPSSYVSEIIKSYKLSSYFAKSVNNKDLLTHEKLIVDTVNCINENQEKSYNVRNLKRAVSYYLILHTIIKQKLENHEINNKLQSMVFKFVIAILNEIKTNETNFAYLEKFLQDPYSYFYVNSIISTRTSEYADPNEFIERFARGRILSSANGEYDEETLNKYIKELNQEKEYLYKFLVKNDYQGNYYRGNFPAFKSILFYIVNGYLNEEDFVLEIGNICNNLSTIQKAKENYFIIGKYQYLTGLEFLDINHFVISKLKSNQYLRAFELVELLNVLTYYSQSNLIDKSVNDIEDIVLKTTLELALENKLDFDNFNIAISSTSDSREALLQDFKIILSKLSILKDEISIFRAAAKFTQEFVKAQHYENIFSNINKEYKFSPNYESFLEYINVIDFVNNLYSLEEADKNIKLHELAIFIRRRYSKEQNLEIFKNEFYNLNQIKLNLQFKVSRMNNAVEVIEKKLTNNLIDEISKACDLIKEKFLFYTGSISFIKYKNSFFRTFYNSTLVLLVLFKLPLIRNNGQGLSRHHIDTNEILP